MTREEFMEKAKTDIDSAFRGQRNRMMNLVEQAWAEGKRNAEVDALTEVVRQALEKAQPRNWPNPVMPWITPTITCDAIRDRPPEAHFREATGDA